METIFNYYKQLSKTTELFDSISKTKSRIRIKGLSGSLSSVITSLYSADNMDKVNLVILSSKEDAFYFMNDVEMLLGETEK